METVAMAELKFTALILAASRRGAQDPVAQIQGLSHKCLVTLNGTPMVQRVIDCLRGAKHISRIFVSIEDPAILRTIPAVAAMLDKGEIATVPSEGNLAQSVYKAVAEIDSPFPLVVSAGDNALHTPEMIDHFCGEVAASEADVYVAMTRAQLILDKYPGGQRAFHRLRDEAYSSCNLYCLKTPDGVKAAEAFATGGQFGKKPERIINAFGIWAFILYKLRLVTLDGVMRQISRAMNVTVRKALIPWAEGPIDVDNAKDYALVTQILEAREGKRT
ncbi:MAG: nucleotidyltransferase family protein [Rhodospirillaceae bacterium]|nr:nucleotidyltransferase family protein [Rhodospirillaceae bacterium]